MNDDALEPRLRNSDFLIPCPYCKWMFSKPIFVNEGPQTLKETCGACHRPMIVFVALYADGRAIVGAEACH